MRKIRSLEKEFGIEVKDYFLGLLGVDRGALEERFGLPAFRKELDWYDVNELRKMRARKIGGDRK